jgi:photosystem II stability/assembly factor-like uncharacterized protein
MNKPKVKVKLSLVLICSVLFSTICISQSIWSIINPTPPWDKYVDVQFFDDLTGYALGDEGRLIKTINGAADWNIINNGDFYILTLC